MTADAPGRTFSRSAIERAVETVRPEWELRDANLADDGVTPVYLLDVEGTGGRRQVVLKAAREDDHPAVGDVGAEARLLAAVREHTSAPVPAVLGVVDDHDAFRTPCFLMESLSGSKVSGVAVGSLADETVRAVARRTGRWLGQLHAVDFENVTTFGRGVEADRTAPLRGERPDGDPTALVFRDGYDDFRAQLRDWWTEDFGEESNVAGGDGLRAAVRETLFDRVESLPPSLSPTVARLDHGWHNLLLDGDAVTGVLDWGNLASFPPAYDLALVEIRLAGGTWLGLPEVPDRRPAVRAAMLSGYREERRVPQAYDAQRRLYQLDVLQSWLTAIETDPTGPGVPHDRAGEARTGLRSLIRELVD